MTSFLVLSSFLAGCAGLAPALKTGLDSPSWAPRGLPRLHEAHALSFSPPPAGGPPPRPPAPSSSTPSVNYFQDSGGTPPTPRCQPLRAGPTGADRARCKGQAASRQQTAEAPVCTEMLLHDVQWVLLEPRHTHTEAFIAYTRARLAESPGQLDAGEASLSVCCSSAKVCAHALPSRNAVQYNRTECRRQRTNPCPKPPSG